MAAKLASLALLAAALPTLAVAASPSVLITPAPVAGQKLGVVGGRPALISAIAGNEVLLVLKKEVVPARDIPVLQLAIYNGGTQPLAITSADVVATTDAGPVHVLSQGELEAQARTDLARALSKPGALPATGHEAFTRQTQATMSVASRPNTYTAVGRNNHDQLMNSGADSIAANRAAYAYEIAQRMAAAATFKPLQADPGASVATPVSLSVLPKKATRLTLTVTIAGQPHAFAYALTPAP